MSKIAKSSDKEVSAREFSSGGIIYRQNGGKLLWLIRKTSASDMFPKTYWMLPKGWLDDLGPDIPGPMAKGEIRASEEILQNTALREVSEETGVVSKIIDKIGTIKFFYTHPTRGRILKFVTFYLMEYVKDLPEGFDFETSKVAWLSFDEAYKTLSFSMEKNVLKDAEKLYQNSV